MQDPSVMLAIQNNAEWCLRVWQAHGLQTYEEEKIWFCPDRVPDLYPNVVTTQPAGPEHIERITAIRAMCVGQEFSVKDSFGELDLGELDFERLFDANWLYLSTRNRARHLPDLNWVSVQSEGDLTNWERHWDDRESEREPIFLPSLLNDPLIGFWAGCSESRFQAGYISIRTGSVVGISNIFGPLEECVAHAACHFSDTGIVSYDELKTVRQMEILGFKAVGDLTIWKST